MAGLEAVGNSATATKKPGGKQVLSEARIRPSENGGFTVEQSYRSESRGDNPGPYIEPKTFTFETFDSMVGHLASALGAPQQPAEPQGGQDDEAAEGEAPPPPAAARPPQAGPLEDSGLYSGVARG